jgi:acylphosphatase
VSDKASFHAIIHGQVQGVFFRAFVAEKAGALNLTGYVRNLSSGNDVEVIAEENQENLEKLIEYLKVGPPAARVEKVTVQWSKYSGKYSRFTIRN